MLDWITLLIEAVGILILCVWIVIPIHEFKLIFRRLRQEGHPTLTHPMHRRHSAHHRPGGPNSGEDD